MADQGTEVWLYRTEAGELVGYASLGKAEWRYPDPRKGPRVAVRIIPFIGVSEAFQGMPPAPTPREERYAWRIFEDLLAKAIERQAHSHLLASLVHKDNERAISFYRAAPFNPAWELPNRIRTGPPRSRPVPETSCPSSPCSPSIAPPSCP
jgi:hypothetical protein